MRSRWVDIYLLFPGFWSLGAQRVAGQGEAVVALHDAVQDSVGDGGVADPGMPVFDGYSLGCYMRNIISACYDAAPVS